MAETVPIPEPPGLPLLGNLGEFSQNPISDIIRLADTYGKAVESLRYTYITITYHLNLPIHVYLLTYSRTCPFSVLTPSLRQRLPYSLSLPYR